MKSVLKMVLVAVAALAVVALANPVEAGCRGGRCGHARHHHCKLFGGGCHTQQTHCVSCVVSEKQGPIQGPVFSEKQSPIQGPTEKQGPQIQGPKVDNSLPEGPDVGNGNDRGRRGGILSPRR